MSSNYYDRKVFKRDKRLCQLCDTRVTRYVPPDHPKRATIDHILPKSMGGTRSLKNLRTLCFPCNIKRGNKLITKPMLAGKVESTKVLHYPVFVTPKLDGIRALVIDGKLLSRKFLPIPNRHIASTLKGIPSVLDGELMIEGESFSNISSNVMSEDGKPDFVYHIFDYVKDNTKKPYLKRMKELVDLDLDKYPHRLIIPEQADSEKDLEAWENHYLLQGYEGIMIRSAYGPYKEGRSTEREGYLLKLKRFEDDEAVVIGFEELLHNSNEVEKDAFGRTKRSQAKDGLSSGGTLGSLIVKSDTFGEFNIGTGFTEDDRLDIWGSREGYLGLIVKFKYQKAGMKDKPRFPVWLGFRDPKDT